MPKNQQTRKGRENKKPKQPKAMFLEPAAIAKVPQPTKPKPGTKR